MHIFLIRKNVDFKISYLFLFETKTPAASYCKIKSSLVADVALNFSKLHIMRDEPTIFAGYLTTGHPAFPERLD